MNNRAVYTNYVNDITTDIDPDCPIEFLLLSLIYLNNK